MGLNISLTKTEVMTLNISNPQPIKVNGKDLPMTDQFKYLGSIVRQDGGAGLDIQSRLNKAKNTFRMLNNVWRSSQYSTHTKLKIYQSCVLSTLCMGQNVGECCKEIWESCQPFILKDCEKYFASSGLRPFPTRICFRGANKRTWVLLLYNDAGGGLAMSFERIMNPSQRQHYTGLPKAGASVAGLRIHGVVLLRQN